VRSLQPQFHRLPRWPNVTRSGCTGAGNGALEVDFHGIPFCSMSSWGKEMENGKDLIEVDVSGRVP